MAPVVFLEAPCRSQELLSLKWLLRSAGYEIASTWHDAPTATSLTHPAHWNGTRMEQMKPFDTLVVLRLDDEEIPGPLGLAVGFAAARRLEIIWIGVPFEPLSQFRNVHSFPNVEAFQKHLLLEKSTRGESQARARPAA